MKYDFVNSILQGSALEQLKTLDSDSIDCLVTDPPYGYSFMNKDWDKAVVGVDTWKECLRVLKPGAFAFIMSSPRQDVLCKMILNLIDAGFETNFTSLYWTYASGFPKAADVSKLVDKRYGRTQSNIQAMKNRLIQLRKNKGLSNERLDQLCGFQATNYFRTDNQYYALFPQGDKWQKIKSILGDSPELETELNILYQEAEREIIGKSDNKIHFENLGEAGYKEKWDITKPATEQAKKLEGAYAGFQPKPAVELILTVMKPLSEKTFVDQALSNGKGCTWLDDCRIPYQSEDQWKRPTMNDIRSNNYGNSNISIPLEREANDKGRFPANLLVEDDVLNDGSVHKSGKIEPHHVFNSSKTEGVYGKFDRNTIAKEITYGDSGSFSRYFSLDSWTEKTLPFLITPKPSKAEKGPNNSHPTVKSRKLMSYLITMGSREGDILLDPFCGSGTVLIAARQLARDFIGIELNEEYIKMAMERLKPYLLQTRLV